MLMRRESRRVGQRWESVLATGEGMHTRSFLSPLCSNWEINQCCAFVGHRSIPALLGVQFSFW